MLLLALCALLALLGAEASKYQETIIVKAGGRFGPVMEGPMYSIPGFVGIVQKTPALGFIGTARLNVPLKSVTTKLYVLFTSSQERLAMFDDPSLAPPVQTLCYKNGSITPQAIDGFGDFNDLIELPIAGSKTAMALDVRTDVRVNGWQHMTFVLCRYLGPIESPGDKVEGVELSLQGEIFFVNPYGYLPGLYYGYLPFMGILSTLYFITFFIFTVLACKHRRTLLRMQVGLLLVIMMGFIETTTWFLTYHVMNETGGGACCPWRTDLVFAITTNDMKRTVSACLVLAVALGWGVVEPRLTRRTTLFILVVGFLYLGTSLKYDLIRMQFASRPDSSSDQASSSDEVTADSILPWALALAIIDVILIFWIYNALSLTMITLETNHETAKLEMYQRLARTLRMWVVLWCLFTFFDILVQGNIIGWPWTLTFLLTGFWDLLYLGVLFSMARIWRPSENSDRYAYSAQLPTDAALDEFDPEAFANGELEQERELEEIGMGSAVPKRGLPV